MFDGLVDETLAGYDGLIGFDLTEVSIDRSQHKAAFVDEGTGPDPTDRGKSDLKWSVATDRNGTPIGWEIAGANRNDCVLLEPTLDAIDARGLLDDIDTMHLDRGYDTSIVRALCAQCAQVGPDDLILGQETQTRRRPSQARRVARHALTSRTHELLAVELRSLRHNTDRFVHHRLDSIALAIALVITVKLIK